VATGKIIGRLVEFSDAQLDSYIPVKVPIKVYCMAYRLLDSPDEIWTSRVNDFKFGSQNQVKAAITVFPQLIKEVLKSPIKSGFAAGLIPSASKTLHTKNRVFLLGRAIAIALNIPWEPNILSKKPHQSLKSIYTGGYDRDMTVKGCYASEVISGFKGRTTVYLVDDFCTRGSTLLDATRAIVESNPRLKIRIVGLILAKNERVHWAGETANNNHLDQYVNDLWIKAGGN